jgi:hypothetical protein
VPKPGGILAYVSFRDWGLVDVTIELPTGSYKFLASMSANGARVFGAIRRRGGDLDYWDGEP